MANQETALVPVPVSVQSPEIGELHLIALNPQQMQDAQKHLQSWADAKALREDSRRKELEQNLVTARKCKWRTSTLVLHVGIAKKRAEFFKKLAMAVAEGYYLVPDMPMDTFVVRSKQSKPTGQASSVNTSHYRWPWLNDVKPKQLEAGVGENRNPVQRVSHREYPAAPNSQNQPRTERITKAVGWQDEIDFPFILAKPEVCEATRRAMGHKLFDEIGVLPQSTKKDPMVLGHIIGPKGLSATFLIAWFLDENHFR